VHDGDVALRAAFDPKRPQFVRRPGSCCKALAVNSDLPVLVFDDHPEDWVVLSPRGIVKATEPWNATKSIVPANFVVELRDFYLTHRPAPILPTGVSPNDALVLKLGIVVGTYVVLWLDAVTMNVGQSCRLVLREASIATETTMESTYFKVSACVLQVFGGSHSREVWCDRKKGGVGTRPDDENQMDLLLKRVGAEPDITFDRVTAAAALRVTRPRLGQDPVLRVGPQEMKSSRKQAVKACEFQWRRQGSARRCPDALLILLALERLGISTTFATRFFMRLVAKRLPKG
jgi:hypothetical protein